MFFFGKSTPKSIKTARRPNRNRRPTEKSWAESDSSSKIIIAEKPGLIQTVHLIPRTRGQRCLRHAEWRTPRFCPKGAQKKNRKESASHHSASRRNTITICEPNKFTNSTSKRLEPLISLHFSTFFFKSPCVADLAPTRSRHHDYAQTWNFPEILIKYYL